MPSSRASRTDKQIFLDLVAETRRTGWRVQQRKLAPSDYGCIYIDTKVIHIEKATTWRVKLHSLAHEIGHVQQTKVAKWDRFFRTAKFEDTKRNRTYVIAAELDASRRAERLLKKLGARKIDFPELDPVRFEVHMKGAWLDEYMYGE